MMIPRPVGASNARLGALPRRARRADLPVCGVCDVPVVFEQQPEIQRADGAPTGVRPAVCGLRTSEIIASFEADAEARRRVVVPTLVCATVGVFSTSEVSAPVLEQEAQVERAAGITALVGAP